MSRKYSDRENQIIANQEYVDYSENEPVEFINDKGEIESIGIVREVIHDDSGLDGYVVENTETKEITMLFQGSKSPFANTPESKADWKMNNIPMLMNLLLQKKASVPQLEAGAAKLNEILRKYPDSTINLYAHSLAGMVVQYSLANVDDITRIGEAHIYQTPNIYSSFTEEQKLKVNALKYRIVNYEDQWDIVSLFYNPINSENAVGIVKHVDSKLLLNIEKQHMWGGYNYDENGSVKIKNDASTFESIFAPAFDSANSRSYLYSLTKSKLSIDGISRSEGIFLDSQQAEIISTGISIAANIGYETISEYQKQAHNAAENLLSTTRTIPFGFISSPDEVENAYYAGGITYSTIVGDIDRKLTPKVEKMRQLSEEFKVIEVSIKKGIEEMLLKDKHLAGEFSKWTKLK